MRRPLIGLIGICVALVHPAFSQVSPRVNDWTVVPGVRAGPITVASTHQDVHRLFPTAAVRDEEIELDEGAMRPGTLVFKDTASERLAIFWDSKGPDAHPKEIFLCFGRRSGACRWQTSGGIQVGTALRDLEKRNGKPFTVSAFGWDYGGNVLSWRDGSLARLDCNGKLVLTLDAPRVSPGEYSAPLTADESHAVSIGPEVSSDLPAMRKLNPTVVGMLLKFAGSDPGKSAGP